VAVFALLLVVASGTYVSQRGVSRGKVSAGGIMGRRSGAGAEVAPPLGFDHRLERRVVAQRISQERQSSLRIRLTLM
jgi:hypothetical protein